jgi:hypothetical protein
MRFSFRTFRYASLLPLAYAVVVACATASESGDQPITPVDASVKATVDGSAAESGFDAGDWTVDTGVIPPFDAGQIEAAPPVEAGVCSTVGVACNPDQFPPTCAFFHACEEWKNPFIFPSDAGFKLDAFANDAGAPVDAGADVDAGPPLEGICLPVFPQAPECNNGIDKCEAGTACLLKPGQCLTPEQADCICNTHPGACAIQL